MTYFESALLILLAAIVLLQVSRRLSLPYPAVLAVVGVVVALIPGTPIITIDPATALALFVAPALLDAAFDFHIKTVARLWKPLFALAVVAVLLTAALVAWIGWAWAGLPLAAAVALGAIVAPPDAAAATAVLGSVSMPPRTLAVLKGESLLNDATALLLFGSAVAIQENGGIDRFISVHLLLAAPGGVAFGVALAWMYRRVLRFVTGSLGGNLLEFVNTFWVWILADHLGLSAVLSVVAFAMTIARTPGLQRPRVRVHSYAVWESVVFLLNVLAFLLMGMQARTIVGEMDKGTLTHALQFAGLVVAGVVGIRMLLVLAYNRLAVRFEAFRADYEPPSLAQGVLVGWSGMRGLVTLATAFALPEAFPQRPLIVLTAFAVVLATLVVQGLTLAPLIRFLGLDQDHTFDHELTMARKLMAQAAIAAVEHLRKPESHYVEHAYEIEVQAIDDPAKQPRFDAQRELALAAVEAERAKLNELVGEQKVGADVFAILQEGLDWKGLALLSETDKRIEES